MLRGAEAAAIASTADMTSVAEIIVATGTDGAADAVKTCFPIVPKRLASPCVDGASECSENDGAVDEGEAEKAVIAYKELQPSATACESVLQFADSLGAVAQWLELGTHNP